MTFSELLEKVGPSNDLLPRIQLDNETHIQLTTPDGNIIEITAFGDKIRVTVIVDGKEDVVFDEERNRVQVSPQLEPQEVLLRESTFEKMTNLFKEVGFEEARTAFFILADNYVVCTDNP